MDQKVNLSFASIKYFKKYITLLTILHIIIKIIEKYALYENAPCLVIKR